MYGNDLLRCVLPIDSALGFRDQPGSVVPKYDDKKTNAENLKAYKLYNMACCELYVEDEINDSLGPDALIDLVVLKAMYHPRFPSTFFNFIASSVDGIPTLQAKDVASYLEQNYGKGLKQEDCDYLSLILELWSKRYPVLYPANLKKAQAWLDKKHESLPAWSTESTVSPADKISEPIGDAKPPKRRAEEGLLSSEIEFLVKGLRGTRLLDPITNKLATGVKSGPVAGVLNYLYKEGHIASSRNAAFRTLNENFGLERGLRTIQGNKRDSTITKAYYDKTLSFFES